MAVVILSHNYEIELIKVAYIIDDIGDSVEEETITKVLAKELDYRTKDYYQALTSGLKPTITFSINKYDYSKEKMLRHEEELYRIIDVSPVKVQYENEFDNIALICEAVI